MRHCFIGLIFIFLDFSVELQSGGVIGLIPDFIGYYFVARGLSELCEESPRFRMARLLAVIAGVCSAILYAVDIIISTDSLGVFGLILSVVSSAMLLWLLYVILSGLLDVEKERRTALGGKALCMTWIVMAVLLVLSYVSLIDPLFALLCAIANLIVSIVFLALFYRAKKRFDSLPARFIYHG